MKIDVFNHILPKTYFDRLNKLTTSLDGLDKKLKSVPLLVDLDSRLKWVNQFGEDYVQVLSLGTRLNW
jgi:aminocarboxymuconate-semialdehyde decarboxylase